MDIKKGGMSFLVTCDDINEEMAVESVVKKYMSKKDGHTWAHEIKKNERGRNRYSVRLHINFLPTFLFKCNLSGIKNEDFNFSNLCTQKGVDVDLPMYPSWVSRAHQKIAIEKMYNKDNRFFLLLMGTGRGKTYCLLRAISKLGGRMILYARPRYLMKWISDISGMYDIPDDSIILVKGKKDLEGLINNKGGVLDGSRCIVMSNATYSAYIVRCRKGTESTGIYPEDLMGHLGVRAIGIDEADEHYHSAFIMALNSNVEKIHFVSATMKTKDRFIKEIHSMSFSPKELYIEKRNSKHIDIRAIMYSFKDKRLCKTRGYKGMYSHSALEKSILANERVLANYVKLVIVSVGDFIEQSKGEGKLIIYAYTKLLCNHIVNAVKKKYRHLDTRRFVDGDPYCNIIEPDVRVTTISSGGRAMDIPGLTGVVLTVAVDSDTANEQISGRLREPDDGSRRLFYYFCCTQLPVHMKYSLNKKSNLFSKTKSFNTIRYANAI